MQSRGLCGARGGSTLIEEGLGHVENTPGPPCDFTLGSRAHFGRTREAVYPDHLNNRSNSQSVCVILNSSEFYEVNP
jgi:hypothetical protein